MKKLGSDIILGILVVTLSIFTAGTNFASYRIGGTGGTHTANARQLLADANTDYSIALQLIILDYTMFDGYYLNDGANNDVADYYLSNFSEVLSASIERSGVIDEQYYDEIYAAADEKTVQAQEEFVKADRAYAKESVLHLAMLIAAVGLAFAAYASLLKEENRLRPVFALLAFVMLAINLSQFLEAYSL